MKELKGMFKPEELAPLEGHLEGKTLVLNPKVLKPRFRRREFLVWKAIGGFGCHPGLMGKAVYATCVSDGEQARWSRGDFVAILIDNPKAGEAVA